LASLKTRTAKTLARAVRCAGSRLADEQEPRVRALEQEPRVRALEACSTQILGRLDQSVRAEFLGCGIWLCVRALRFMIDSKNLFIGQ
jgi:hypothetical protein